MGVFSVDLEVGSPVREQFVTVQAMVDTGAIYTMLPEDLLDYLGVKRLESDIFEMADDRPVEYWIGSATVRLARTPVARASDFRQPGQYAAGRRNDAGDTAPHR